MRDLFKLKFSAAVLCTMLNCPSRICAQGTLQITFAGPPLQPPGTAFAVTNYLESGMSFTPLGVSFGRIGSSPEGGRPDNGTAYLQAALSQSLMFRLSNGSQFNLISVDLAEYSTVFQTPLTVPFIGYRQDGSTVTANFTTDGIIDGTGPLADFQTFNFGPQFSGLTRVEIPNSGWSLDNLVVNVPEPETWILFSAGGLLLWLGSRRRRKGVKQ